MEVERRERSMRDGLCSDLSDREVASSEVPMEAQRYLRLTYVLGGYLLVATMSNAADFGT